MLFALLAAKFLRIPLLLSAVPLWLMEWGFEIFVAGWLFCVGAAVGSFLNVVVYRLPRRMNLMVPSSHCPRCQTPIRAADNIPIFSWLWLGGRCRVCRSPISPRYVRVELLVALLFLGIALAELHGPWRQATRGLAGLRAPLSRFDELPFWFTYATHVVLASTLLAAALIDRDGFRTPRLLFAPTIMLGLIGVTLWPAALRLPALVEEHFTGWQTGLADGLIGLACGALIGVLIGFWWRNGSRTSGWPRFAPAMLFAAIGVMLGWQRTGLLAVGTLAALITLLGAIRISRGRLYFAPAAITLMFAMPCLVDLDFAWPEWTKVVTGPAWGLIVVVLITVELLALAIGALAPAAYCQETAPPDLPPVSHNSESEQAAISTDQSTNPGSVASFNETTADSTDSADR